MNECEHIITFGKNSPCKAEMKGWQKYVGELKVCNKCGLIYGEKSDKNNKQGE
jgi:hypothetical protein